MKGKDKIYARSSWSISGNIKNVQIGIPDRKEHLKLGSGHTLREVVVLESRVETCLNLIPRTFPFVRAKERSWERGCILNALYNRPFPSSCPSPLQSESKCDVFLVKIRSYSIGINRFNRNRFRLKRLRFPNSTLLQPFSVETR